MDYKVLTAFFFAALLFGCCGLTDFFTPEKQPLELVPDEASMIAFMKLSQILNDPDLQNLYFEMNQGKTLDDAFSELEADTGVDLRKVDSAVAVQLESPGTTSNAFILKGKDISLQEVAEFHAAASAVWTASEYEGVRVYLSSSSGEAVAIVSGNVVAGDLDAVKAIILKSKSSQGTQTPEMQARDKVTQKLDLNSTMWFFRVMGPGDTAVLGEDPTGLLNQTISFDDVEAAGAHLNKQGDSVEIKMVFLASSSSQASKIASEVNAFKGLALFFTEPGSSLRSVMTKLTAGSSGETAFIGLDSNVSELRGLKAELDAQED